MNDLIREELVEAARVKRDLDNSERIQLDLQYANLRRDPSIVLIISFVAGLAGFDRMYLGQVGLGVAKLLTLGGVGWWWLIDLFLIRRAAATANSRVLNELKAQIGENRG